MGFNWQNCERLLFDWQPKGDALFPEIINQTRVLEE